MSVKLHHISKSYGNQQVLKGLDFSVEPGEIVGFLGPNGAGKSTTMKIITGSLRSDSGSVEICGLDIEKHPLEAKKLIGYLPEHNPLYTDMYVREYLGFMADIHQLGKKKPARINEVIEMVGLQKEAYKKIGQLSKGYRQRTGLAQALIHDPKVLILDEPTAGLDPNQLVEIRKLIKETGRDRTVIFSTHIMQEIEAVCSRVIIINKGEIVADYPNIKSLDSPGENRYRIEAEFLNPVENVAVKSIISAETKDQRNFVFICEEDIRDSLFDFAVSTNNKLLSVKMAAREIEEIFREMTSE